MEIKIQPVRGTKDLLPEEFNKHEYIIQIARNIGKLYGFEGLSTPIFEFSHIFSRSLGETSDVVHKEMYSFDDRGGESLTLRPEFTAGVVRAFISNGLQQKLPGKYFSTGPLFRYERPQAGRQRQFHQINFEYFGADLPTSDAETIKLACDILSKLDILKDVKLELNSLGCFESRANYRNLLVNYLSSFKSKLSADSLLRLERNPMRILDSKDEGDREIIKNAPLISDAYTLEAREYFKLVTSYLDELNISYIINERLVRGLDYYTHTAFEFTTDKLGAQGTVLAGGRYDGLVKQLGGIDTKAIGFASGIERLAMMLNLNLELDRPNMVLPLEAGNIAYALKVADLLRSNGLNAELDISGKIAKRMQRANNKGAKFVLLIGDNEMIASQVRVKELDSGRESDVSIERIAAFIMSAKKQ